MRYKAGDRVRATRFSTYEGDTGTVHNIDEAVCDNAVAVLWDDNGWCHYDTDDVRIEPLPTEEKEKPVEQKYEVGGTLTLAEAIKAAKSGEIIAEAREGSRAVWKEQALRWEATGSTVHIHEYYLTGWRVVPKPVPMTRELQEALDRLCEASTRIVFNELEGGIYRAYQKAKEQAK